MATEDLSRYNAEGTQLRKAQLRLLDMLIEFDRICTKHRIRYFLSGGSCLGAVRHQGFIPWDDDIDIDVWQSDYDKLIEVLPDELPEQYFMQTSSTDKTFYRLIMRICDKNSHSSMFDEMSNRKSLANTGLFLDVLPLKNVSSYRIKKLIERVYKPCFAKMRTHSGRRSRILLAYPLYPCIKLIAWFMSIVDKFAAPTEKVSHAYGTGMTPKLNHSELFPVQQVLFEGYYFQVPAKTHEYLTGLYGNYMTIPKEGGRESHAASVEVYEPK